MSIRGGWDFSVGPHPIPAANTLRTLMLDPPAPTQSPWWLHGAETGGMCKARGRRGEGATEANGTLTVWTSGGRGGPGSHRLQMHPGVEARWEPGRETGLGRNQEFVVTHGIRDAHEHLGPACSVVHKTKRGRRGCAARRRVAGVSGLPYGQAWVRWPVLSVPGPGAAEGRAGTPPRRSLSRGQAGTGEGRREGRCEEAPGPDVASAQRRRAWGSFSTMVGEPLLQEGVGMAPRACRLSPALGLWLVYSECFTSACHLQRQTRHT